MVKKPLRPKGGPAFGKMMNSHGFSEKIKEMKAQVKTDDPKLLRNSIGVHSLDTNQVHSLRYYWD